jgi:hypothetical protein
MSSSEDGALLLTAQTVEIEATWPSVFDGSRGVSGIGNRLECAYNRTSENCPVARGKPKFLLRHPNEVGLHRDGGEVLKPPVEGLVLVSSRLIRPDPHLR